MLKVAKILSKSNDGKRAQEIRAFRKTDDSFKKIIITRDFIQPYYNEYGILTMNIDDFLLAQRCLDIRLEHAKLRADSLENTQNLRISIAYFSFCGILHLG